MLQKRRTYFTGKKSSGANNQVASAQTNTGFGLFGTMPKQYNYPIMKNIAPGDYISEIDKVEFSKTKKGIPSLVVSYTLEQSNQNSGKKHHIKQSYPKDSKPLEQFNIAMTNALNLEEGEEYDPSDCIGVKEKVTLSYQDEDKFGGFSKRTPLKDENVDEDNTDDITSSADSSDNTAAPQNMRLSPADEYSDDFDDYDDFLDNEE